MFIDAIALIKQYIKIMYNEFFKKVESRTTLANIFIAILAQTLIQVILVLLIAPEIQKYSQGSILDLRLLYSGDEAFNYFNELGNQGRQWYKYSTFLDLIYPFAYSAALIFLFIYLGKRALFSENIQKVLIAVPLVLFLLDYVENFGFLAMLLSFPNRLFIYKYSGYITLIKHILFFSNMMLLSFTGLMALKKQFMKS